MPGINLERDLHTGRRLGRYEIICQMSSGGMSEIYLGCQRGLGGFTKPVVLKCFSQTLGDDPGLLGMFLDEGRITASLAHPNIGQIYDLGEQDGEFYFAMEFIQGATLIELARALKPLDELVPIGFALATARDVALALHHAHNFQDESGRLKPIVHRDVAGKNIMVSYDGVTKLFDFGIAKFASQVDKSRVAGVKGTSGYMAPEQIRSRKVDARTDVFALAVVLHECLTGNRLSHGRTLAEELHAALEAPAPPPSAIDPEVPEALDAVVLRALEKEPENRYPTALEFGRALEGAAASLFWKPEQRGALMMEHFAQRRERARALFASLSAAPSPPPAPVRTASIVAPLPGPPAGVEVKTVPLRKLTAPRQEAATATTDPGVEGPTQLGPPPPPPERPDPALVKTVATVSPLVEQPLALAGGLEPFGDTETSDAEPKTVVTPGAPPPADPLPLAEETDTGSLTQVALPRRPVLARALAATAGVLVLSGLAIWGAQRMPPPREEATAPLAVRGKKVAAPEVQRFSAEAQPAQKWPETLRFETKPPPARPPAPAHKPELVLETTPSAQVRLGQRLLGNTPINVNLAPGVYDLSLLGADGVERHLRVEMKASGNTVLKLPLSVVPTQ